MSPYFFKPQKTPNTPRPQNPKTPSAFGLLTIKDQLRASYGRRPEKSSVLDFVELGFEAFALSIFLSRSSLPIMS